MANEQNRLDIVSNNLANAATVGYKQDSVTNQSFDNLLTIKIKDASEQFHDRAIGTMSLGVKMGEVYTNYGQGPLRETGNNFDLAIEGRGFFNVSVTDEKGNETTQYTRDGSFTLTQDGYLKDADGNYLLGESGKITIPENTAEVKVDADGSIYADGTFAGKVKLTDFNAPDNVNSSEYDGYKYLQKVGANRYIALDGATPVDATGIIQQGFTEQSNVNVVSEMVDMIAITRAYEANQKVIQTVDGTLDLAANSIGKI
jgi:flagellar basal-body rod protein FlgG